MIKKIAAILLLTTALTACTKSATIEARTGPGGQDQPTIDCHVQVANPDYVAPDDDKEP